MTTAKITITKIKINNSRDEQQQFIDREKKIT